MRLAVTDLVRADHHLERIAQAVGVQLLEELGATVRAVRDHRQAQSFAAQPVERLVCVGEEPPSEERTADV